MFSAFVATLLLCPTTRTSRPTPEPPRHIQLLRRLLGSAHLPQLNRFTIFRQPAPGKPFNILFLSTGSPFAKDPERHPRAQRLSKPSIDSSPSRDVLHPRPPSDLSMLARLCSILQPGGTGCRLRDFASPTPLPTPLQKPPRKPSEYAGEQDQQKTSKSSKQYTLSILDRMGREYGRALGPRERWRDDDRGYPVTGGDTCRQAPPRLPAPVQPEGQTGRGTRPPTTGSARHKKTGRMMKSGRLLR